MDYNIFNAFTPSNESSVDRSSYLEDWQKMRSKGVDIQERIKVLLQKLEVGVDWKSHDQEQLSLLLTKRKEIAEQIGFFVLSCLRNKLDLPFLGLEKSPEQLSLFNYELPDDSLSWLRHKIEEIGAPEILEESDVNSEIDTIEDSLRDCSSWSVYHAEHQQVLFEQLVARLRYIQEECIGNHDRRIRSIFHRITDYSKKHTPGFIHGLSLSHKPRNERWLEDAHDSWKKIMVEIQKSPEKESLEQVLPLLQQPIDVENLEEALLSHRPFWSFANTLRRLSPHLALFAARPKLTDLVQGLKDYLQTLGQNQ